MICFQNKSEQIRETPFCRPLLQVPDFRDAPTWQVSKLKIHNNIRKGVAGPPHLHSPPHRKRAILSQGLHVVVLWFACHIFCEHQLIYRRAKGLLRHTAPQFMVYFRACFRQKNRIGVVEVVSKSAPPAVVQYWLASERMQVFVILRDLAPSSPGKKDFYKLGVPPWSLLLSKRTSRFRGFFPRDFGVPKDIWLNLT